MLGERHNGGHHKRRDTNADQVAYPAVDGACERRSWRLPLATLALTREVMRSAHVGSWPITSFRRRAVSRSLSKKADIERQAQPAASVENDSMPTSLPQSITRSARRRTSGGTTMPKI